VKVLMVGLGTFEQMTGGSARYMSGLRDSLLAMGHDVRVRTASSVVGSPGYAELGLRGQIVRSIKRLLIHMPASALTVLRFRPDVVNSHFALDGLGGVAAARLLRIPVVVNFQGPWTGESVATGRRGRFPFSSRLRHGLEGWVYRRASICIVLSHAFGEMLVEDFGVKRDHVRVIPAGFDPASFENVSRDAGRKRLGLDDAITAVSVRRLVPRMGIDIAIRAVAGLPRETVGRYLVAGSGPERPGLESLAEELGVTDRVVFLGRVPDEDLPWLYAAADLSIVPTRDLEGFGYVALESLAAGTPVIATSNGGLVDLVGGLDARLLTEGTPGAIAAAIEELVRHRADYPDSAACRAYASSFTWSRIAARIAELFELLANGTPPSKIAIGDVPAMGPEHD
jgi:glycosyltransferase involved in cell wall biosynthesis